MMKKKGLKASSKYDAKVFDTKLVDRALTLLLEYQKIHQFAIVKCQARPLLKRSSELQEMIMAKGLAPDTIPQIINNEPPSTDKNIMYQQYSLEG